MNDNGIYDEIYGKLINTINIIFIAGWAIVTLIELILGIFITQSPNFEKELFTGYFLPYVIAPAGGNFVVIIVTLILLKSSISSIAIAKPLLSLLALESFASKTL